MADLFPNRDFMKAYLRFRTHLKKQTWSNTEIVTSAKGEDAVGAVGAVDGKGGEGGEDGKDGKESKDEGGEGSENDEDEELVFSFNQKDLVSQEYLSGQQS